MKAHKLTITLSLHFGATASPLKEQLKKMTGATWAADALDHFQKDADAVTRLFVRNLITDAQAHRARQKLVNKITKAATFP
jgi:hypothetical protein